MSLGVFNNYSTLVGPGEIIQGQEPVVPRQVDPESEHVAVQSYRASIGVESFASYGCFFRRQPLNVLKAMQLSPPVSSSLSALKAGALSGGFVFTPAIRDKAPTEDDADAAEAQRAVEECLHSAFRMEQPLEMWAWEMLDAMAEGHKLSEIVMEALGDGPFAGSYGLKALKTKPRWSYRFRVDAAMNVEAIDCYTVDDRWESIDPRHFAWIGWDTKDGDPRGNPMLDACFHAFNLLMQLWPEFYVGNMKFGTPALFITTSPAWKQMLPPRDSNGQEIPGARPVTAEFAAAKQGERIKGGATVAMPYESKAMVIESQRDGVGMNNAIAILEAQIVKTILLQVRATMESRHGSKADSETGQDVLGTLLRYVRGWLCQPVRRVFWQLLAVNHGADYANRYTPHIGLGRIEPQDFVAFATAIGGLYQSGYLTETQLPEMDAFLNIPQRRQGDPRVGPQKDAAAMKPDTPTPAKSDKGVAA